MNCYIFYTGMRLFLQDFTSNNWINTRASPTPQQSSPVLTSYLGGLDQPELAGRLSVGPIASYMFIQENTHQAPKALNYLQFKKMHLRKIYWF